jgi:hypothetical protein
MSFGAAAAYELGGGVSLVVFESNPVFEGAGFEGAGESARAGVLRASRGRFLRQASATSDRLPAA